jgi:hypothetical protein
MCRVIRAVGRGDTSAVRAVQFGWESTAEVDDKAIISVLLNPLKVTALIIIKVLRHRQTSLSSIRRTANFVDLHYITLHNRCMWYVNQQLLRHWLLKTNRHRHFCEYCIDIQTNGMLAVALAFLPYERLTLAKVVGAVPVDTCR